MDVKVPCLCEPPRHGEDTITLRDRLPFAGAMAAKNAVTLLKVDDPDASSADVLAVMTEHYLIHGIESWTLTTEDPKGRVMPLPVTRPAIRERVLTRTEVAFDLADAADGLYTEAVLIPLVERASASSRRTPTADGSTSPTTGSEPTPQKPSKRSSTTTTPTDDTGTTSSSPAGDSSSSPSSTSAA